MRIMLLVAQLVLLTTVQPATAQSTAQPTTGSDSQRAKHLQQALEHLAAAGLKELAEQVRGHIQRETDRSQLQAKRDELQQILARSQRLQAEIKELAGRLVGGVEGQQILIELRVLEISLNKLRKQGIQIGESGLGALLEQKTSVTCGKQGYVKGVVGRNPSFANTLAALQEAGLVKTLAEPTLITVSGRPASFRSGGAFPIVVPQSTGGVAVEYREFGTRVDVLPVDLGDGRVRLEMRPVISEIDPERSTTVGDTTVPGLRIRAVDIVAEIENGQTLAIVGIIETRSKALPKDAAAGDPEADVEQVELIVLATASLAAKPQLEPITTTASSAPADAAPRSLPAQDPVTSR